MIIYKTTKWRNVSLEKFRVWGSDVGPNKSWQFNDVNHRASKQKLVRQMHSYSNRCFLCLLRTTASMKRQRCKQLWHYHWLKTDRAHTTAPSALLLILLGGRGHHPPSRHSWASLVHGACTAAPPQTGLVISLETFVTASFGDVKRKLDSSQ